MDQYKEFVCSWIDTNKGSIIRVSDKIWELAELGLAEFKSSRILIEQMERHDFKVDQGIAGMPTAFLAEWGEGEPIIAILGEYDALPGLSQDRVPVRSPLEPGKPGHGCGHNIHGASGMAAAIALKNAMDEFGLKGIIRFYGCPAEENFSGKVFMVRDGYFKDVDVALSHHPSSMNAVSLKSSLCVSSVKFHFYGMAAHAAVSPEQGRSSLDAVELMNIGVNYLREHIIQDARIHYIIQSGGEQPNIVPAYAQSWYYLRAPEIDQLKFIYSWVLDIAEGAAKMTRTQLRVEPLGGLYNLIPNRTIAEVIVKNMREIGLPRYTDEEMRIAEEVAKSISREVKIEELKKSGRPGWDRLVDKIIDDEVPDPWGDGEWSHGSTDVGDVSWQVPTVEFNTAAWVLGTPAHSWQAVAQSGTSLGHKSLIFAAKVMATTALDLLSDNHLLEQARMEHSKRLGSRNYESPLPEYAKPPLDFWQKLYNKKS
ncbi:MAG: amidohydrolase [Nitrososphaerota archaeon]|nr:amidohydrolase [Candidatus Bathyarchaeota archaeon]MDW8048680.1 amidohydrolase [Nitrososphaerota archaeon]